MFKWFRPFKALVENQIGKKIKTLRTDNRTEYESNEFNDFYRVVDIKNETIVPYTQKQNGVTERKNQTIMEPTCAMIYDQGLPKFLWGEAANTTVYVQNRSPHPALDFKTPEEVFICKKPNVSHFIIFGCPAYFHVPKEKRNKLEASGKKGIFVEYNENSKAYRIYVPGQRDVEVRRDVTFDEDIALKKVEDLPISRKDDDDAAEKQEPSMNEPMPNVDDPMVPLGPPPDDPSTSRKRPLWLKGTLQGVEKHTAPRGTFRESKKSNRYQGYLVAMSTIIQVEPCTSKEAIKHQEWKDAMNEEYKSIMKNDIWEVMPRPKDKSVVTSKWIYKIKHGADGSVEKHKARFVGRGFSQKEVDYDEIFALVAQYTTIRSIIALTTNHGWSLHQIDIKTAFLHGSLKEEVYLEQLRGFKYKIKGLMYAG